jgi:hypothetical protein
LLLAATAQNVRKLAKLIPTRRPAIARAGEPAPPRPQSAPPTLSPSADFFNGIHRSRTFERLGFNGRNWPKAE